ncbi:DUF1080 domain-containing protein [Halieaceae bacterium IMCC14734]|uniref:DUF1080 domain-containing protein n=1 Tax=Candidatus Litorirhabdus singularis TaxID=2518993 RepID=A0ABT3TKJ1_9GAMM|nr:family 16 glycoside hydrolase [Candidatus Litorirhabdus singularis]MCX2982295.1 DUF1080 domain-containing protein [Candidatus Litorirhabdus singularis]
MKFLGKLFLIYVPALLVVLTLLVSLYVWQARLMTRSDFDYLVEVGSKHGPAAVWSIIAAELGGSAEMATDPGYGRSLVEGRGHAPWVVRSNLDARPRMLSFALAPGIWAAYDTSTVSLYQVWQGELLFQGATYDYRHGPQPESRGVWYLRQEQPTQWYLGASAVTAQPAKATYLGHEYGVDRKTAGLRFSLASAAARLQLVEYPELSRGAEGLSLLRQFRVEEGSPELQAWYRNGEGPLQLAGADTLVLLTQTTPIPEREFQRRIEVDSGVNERGKQVIADSDCLSCHAEQHQVTGPAWTRIAGRYRGYVQEESVTALADSVIQGGGGKWGKLQMTPHPQISPEDARAAVTYILSRPDPGVAQNVPMDASGEPYAATRDYDINPFLQSVHPAFKLEGLLPEGFEPKVGGMGFRSDGKLVVASWDLDGGVFLIDPSGVEPPLRIAEGLHEPLGVAVVDSSLYVLQKQELTQLIDHDGDEIIDEYRVVSRDWPTSANFHSFAFGLVHKDGKLYALLSVCVLPGGASCPEQLPTQGKLLEIALEDGSARIIASGFRTPNGIGLGPDDELFVTDNQGDWLPANKLVHVQPGGFYGSRVVPDAGVMELREQPPVVWLPQDEIGNSPSQPLLLNEGPYRGQMIHGDVTNGGIKRVFMESVDGQLQGAAFHFSGGLQGNVNRLERGPDGSIYVGELGNPPNWGEIGKVWHGLERLTYQGQPAYEILSIEANSDGFTLTLTEPLAQDLQPVAADLIARQWFYFPNEQYGGPKYDAHELPVSELQLSADRLQLRAVIPQLKPGYVVYLRLNPRLISVSGEKLWISEGWYTLNAIPQASDVIALSDTHSQWQSLFDGSNFGGWRNYGGQPGEVGGWVINDGMLELQPGDWFPWWRMVWAAISGAGSGDLIYATEKFKNFELSLEWKIGVNGNSGIFYLVADEAHNSPWETGLEMQVLDNEGHPDGAITTHRAGDLYDLLAADPETVKPPGEWNHILLRVQDNQIEHWLNGVRVVAIERGGEQWDSLLAASKFTEMPDFGLADTGYIVLQDHGDPVWYRNIKVRKLQ